MITTTIVGNIGRDAELRTLGSGKAVLNFSVAAKPAVKDAESIWFDCAVFGERGAKLAPYLKKGARVTVAGSLNRVDKDGRTYLKVSVQEIDFATPKPAQREPGDDSDLDPTNW
jgi:single-strand DNA-binding protein